MQSATIHETANRVVFIGKPPIETRPTGDGNIVHNQAAMLERTIGWLTLAVLCGCSGGSGTAPERPAWALVIHGGAGVISRDLPADQREAREAALEQALVSGKSVLERGGSSLDAVEVVIRRLEDDPWFNAGRGAVFNHDGGHELDASIMDGRTLACGAVAGVRTVKNPISLARRVMERTNHVLLAGPGADRFAEEQGVERVDPQYFFTEYRHAKYRDALRDAAEGPGRDTVGAAALDQLGNLAAGTSTGGLTNKLYGRVGDSPIIGAGTYAKNETCAVSATGKGEEFIRHGVAHAISFLIEHEELSLQEAAERIVHQVLRPGDGGIIGVARDGSLVMVFNTMGMYRGAADSSGRFEVRIWE